MPIKNETPDPRVAEMREGFIEDCADLWDKNQERFMALLNSSDAKAVKLTFSTLIDFSESEANMETEIGYGQRFKDKRKRQFGDPNQAELPEIGRRPGTGLPDGVTGNGHEERNGAVGTEAGEATPAAYKERQPEENGASKTETKKKGGRRSAKTAASK